jgi:flagellar biosynthetic protein FliQ
MAAFESLLREALVTTALIALPVLAFAALLGTAVAVVQAATQVQEQTLTLLPKILAVGTLATVGGTWAMHALGALFLHAVASAPVLSAAGP